MNCNLRTFFHSLFALILGLVCQIEILAGSNHNLSLDERITKINNLISKNINHAQNFIETSHKEKSKKNLYYKSSSIKVDTFGNFHFDNEFITKVSNRSISLAFHKEHKPTKKVLNKITKKSNIAPLLKNQKPFNSLFNRTAQTNSSSSTSKRVFRKTNSSSSQNSRSPASVIEQKSDKVENKISTSSAIINIRPKQNNVTKELQGVETPNDQISVASSTLIEVSNAQVTDTTNDDILNDSKDGDSTVVTDDPSEQTDDNDEEENKDEDDIDLTPEIVEIATGSVSTNSFSVSTSSAITKHKGRLYIAQITYTKDKASVLDVSGLNISWSLIETSSSANNEVNQEIWFGISEEDNLDDTVNASFSDKVDEASIMIHSIENTNSQSPFSSIFSSSSTAKSKNITTDFSRDRNDSLIIAFSVFQKVNATLTYSVNTSSYSVIDVDNKLFSNCDSINDIQDNDVVSDFAQISQKADWSLIIIEIN